MQRSSVKQYPFFVSAADCKKTTLGKDYTGTLSKTISGRTCQRWDSQTPHPHANTRADWFPDVTVKDAANYCRNPADWAEGPFCFTTDQEVQWEICDLPFCEGIYHSGRYVGTDLFRIVDRHWSEFERIFHESCL